MTTEAKSSGSRLHGGSAFAYGALGVVAVAASLALAVGVGAVHVPIEVVLDVVGRRMNLFDVPVTMLDDQIVWELRMPRAVGAAATGAGLALGGAILQTLTRNALADPYVLGISGGASVGAVTVIVLGVSVAGLFGPAMIAVGAFGGALAALAAVFALAAGRGGALTPSRTILAGVVVGQVCAAYTAFLVMAEGDNDSARRVLTWTLGSMASVRWSAAVVLAILVVVALGLALSTARWLDALAFGETSARSLGVPVTGLRWALMIGASLLTAVLVSYTGAIGFVGLIVPHVVRMVYGPLHTRLLPLTVIAGALLLVWADTLARVVLSDQELPIGVVTAAVGAPVLALLLRQEARR